MRNLSGPEPYLPGLKALADDVYITTGRMAIIELVDSLLVVDPGDEEMFDARHKPIDALLDLLYIMQNTKKPLKAVLLTHSHEDHVANLKLFRQLKSAESFNFFLCAHEQSPLNPSLFINATTEIFPGVVAIPTPGHSAEGDDLSFHLPQQRILFSGDIVQPKGETWEEAFYPSPYPYFTDGDLYVSSLDRLIALDFDILVTGHREVKTGHQARQWLELTKYSILRVREEVQRCGASSDFLFAAEKIFKKLSQERGIEPEVTALRMMKDGRGGSVFARCDLPGIAYYWKQRFGGGR